VDVTVLDRIDVDTMFQPGGNDFESPDLLGCIEPKTVGSQKRYFMRLLTACRWWNSRRPPRMSCPMPGLAKMCRSSGTRAWPAMRKKAFAKWSPTC